MGIIFIIFCFCNGFPSLNAEWDRLILYEDSGILINDTTGFSTVNQRAKFVLCGEGKSVQGCAVNDQCCECGSCSTNTIIADFTVALEIISKSSAIRLGQVATTLNDLIGDVKTIFKKTDGTLSREKLVETIATTFKSLEKDLLIQSETIGIVSSHIVEFFRPVQIDLQKITKARSVAIKNSAASDLGHHIIFLLDGIAELSKLTSGVCNLTDNLSEAIYTITLVTTTALFFIEQSLVQIAIQVNKVGFRNDIASSMCMHISSALEQFVSVVQRISECSDVQCLKKQLPTIVSSLCTTRTKFVNGVSSLIGFRDKYPLSPSLFGIVDSIMNSVRGSKYLKEAEAAINDTIFSLFDVSKSIQAARIGCCSINGFTASADAAIRKVLVFTHTIVFMIANIEDGCFSSGNSLLMLLATLNSIVVKVMCSIDEVMQSFLSLGDITVGGTSLMKVFEAVVDVTASVVECVAAIFSQLSGGSHFINWSKSVPHIMLGAKNKIITARDRLNQCVDAGGYAYPYNVDTIIEASLTIQSYHEFKSNIPTLVFKLDCSKGNDRVVDDSSTTKADIFIGKLKSTAERLSNDGAGSLIAGAVNEVCDDVYDTLIRLSTLSLEKGDVLKLVCLIIGNYHYAYVTLFSIFNCSHYGVNISVF